MKVIGLEIKNIGIIEDVNLTLDKALMLFYGDLRQGKSTILKAFQWGVGGAFPADILRHGSSEGHVIIRLNNGSITRSWYRGADQTTKARDIILIKEGRQVVRPAAEIAALLNPFLKDPEYLAKMSSLERKKYFVEMFSIDTDSLDKEYTTLEGEAKTLRAEIKAYGEIIITPLQKVDLEVFRRQRRAVHSDNEELSRLHREAVAKVVAHNGEIDKAAEDLIVQGTYLEKIRAEIDRLQAQLDVALTQANAAQAFLNANVKQEKPAPPELKSVGDIDALIEEGAAQNVRAEQVEKDEKRLQEKTNKELSLVEKESRQRDIREEKLALLAKISESCGVPELKFFEDGGFSYQAVADGMLSTSQIMRLSEAISGLYPEGLGITLLDRAESLGRSIFDFVARAKAEDKTILAAIVGERPAAVPADVGVFVVENGRIA